MADGQQRVRIDDLDVDDEDEVGGFAYDRTISRTSSYSPSLKTRAPLASFNPVDLLGNTNWSGNNCVAGVRA